MSMFWIIGIVANVVFFAVAMYWIVQQWKKSKSSRQPRNSNPNP